MNWLDIMEKQRRDEYDEQAMEKHREWESLANNHAERKEFVRKGYDPDMLNEFCFYPPELWGKLIQWFRLCASQEEEEMNKKIMRAGILNVRMDPDAMLGSEDPTEADVWIEGRFLLERFYQAAEEWQDREPALDKVSFGLNLLSGGFLVRNDKDFETREEARTLVFLPPEENEESAKYEEEEPEDQGEPDLWNLFEHEEPCGNPEDGYWITAPNGETHLYPKPDPLFYAMLRDDVHLIGHDRYGNTLHPNDPQFQYELQQSELEEIRRHERMIQDMDEQEQEYNDACEMAFLHGGKPEDYL